MLRTSNHIIRSFVPTCTRHLRSVSSSSYKQLEINTTPGLESRQGHPAPSKARPNIKYYTVSDSAGEPHAPPHRHSHESNKAAAEDPLQHVLNHPSASIILRDACKCSRCKDHSTSQRDFNLAYIPTDIKPSSAEQDALGNWTIRWQNDMPGWEDHVSIFTPHQVERLRRYTKDEHKTAAQLWDKAEYEKTRFTVKYDDYLCSDEALAKTLFHFARYGLVLITDIPEDEHAVERIANRIGSMKSTFYGPTWDIKSMPNAKNVAFTNKHLGFHGDLMYLKEPPTGQFLHCIHNSCAGGESRFVDQFKALDTLFSEDPDLAFTLSKTRLRYEYENDGFYYSDIKPIVQFRTDGHLFPHRRVRGAVNQQRMNNVYRMFWGPQFLGSIVSDLSVTESMMRKSLQAMKKYAEILERDELVFQEKMIPGTCVMFDNLRVLHARNEFDMNTGKRWLRGTYVDAQELWSMEMRLKNYMNDLEQVTGKPDE